ncbi:MAG: DUF421 domain-containing protein [Firmicutes bacterium]|nr:DUF421 domain-containing protein [Bacillota bacterium]
MAAASLLLVVVKTFGLYALALAAFRLMGKRTLGDMEPLDFVVVLTIAEIVGAPLADPGLSLWPPVVAVSTLALLQLLLAQIVLASPRMRHLLEGKPVVVIKQGRVLERNLRRARVSPAELAERLRERGFLGPEDVEIAILETDGMLSAIPRREAAPVTPRFLGLQASELVLLRGRPEPEGLRRVGLTWARLEEVLRRRGLDPADAEEVVVDRRGRLHVVLRLDRREVSASGPSTHAPGPRAPEGARERRRKRWTLRRS